jgi:hypothetical protein
VAALTKSLAKELASKGITINAVAPGFIETEMMAGIPDKVQQKLLGQIPMGRFGKAEEVSRACVYFRQGAGSSASHLVPEGGHDLSGEPYQARWPKPSSQWTCETPRDAWLARRRGRGEIQGRCRRGLGLPHEPR